MGPRAILAMGLSLLVAYVPVAPAASPAVVGKMQTKGAAEINGAAVPDETTVFAGDRITTEKETASGLSLPGGDQVFLPSLTAAKVGRSGKRVTVTLERGALAVVNRSAEPVLIEASGVSIESAGPAGVYEVTIQGNALKVMTRKGTTLVKGADRTIEVKEGTTLEASAAPGPVAGTGALSPLWTTVLVASTAAGFTGLALGVTAVQRSNPADCTVVSPNTIHCP